MAIVICKFLFHYFNFEVIEQSSLRSLYRASYIKRISFIAVSDDSGLFDGHALDGLAAADQCGSPESGPKAALKRT